MKKEEPIDLSRWWHKRELDFKIPFTQKRIEKLGKFHLNTKEIGAIMDCFHNLNFKTKDGRIPVLVAKTKTDYGWHLVWNLPPGISFSQVKRKQDYFADATKSFIVLTWDNALHMDVQTNSLPNYIPYKWEPAKEGILPIPVGYTPKGLEVFDLTEAPHMFIAGQTGFGKSNQIHVIINALLHIPNVWVCVVDPKRLDFRYLQKHVLLIRDQHEVLSFFKALNKEHDRRVELIENAPVDVVKIQEYEGDLPYIVAIIDEWAQLPNEVLPLINRLLSLSRASGISLIGATQYPSVEVLGKGNRDLFEARLCFLVGSEISSRMVLGEQFSQAAWLPAIKGRALWKFGHEIKEVQTMFLSKKDRTKLAQLHQPRRWEIESKKLLPR